MYKRQAIHKPSAQHVLDEDYYKRIEAIQFTMSHDDGKKTEDISNSDVILLGVSRTSKTPTSIYLANRGFKTTNIHLVPKQEIPEIFIKLPKRDGITRYRLSSLASNMTSDEMEEQILKAERNETLLFYSMGGITLVMLILVIFLGSTSI